MLAQTSAALHADMTRIAQEEVAGLRTQLPTLVRAQVASPAITPRTPRTGP
jgi:hypothetical protein